MADEKGKPQAETKSPEPPKLPPSRKVLEDRLRARGSDDLATVERRLGRAEEEIRELREEYDFLVVNDELEAAVHDVLHVIGASRVRRERMVERLRDRFETD